MPFDPRLIQPDDAPLRADGDLDLPSDLTALAEQLSDDAVHLAAHYPAEREVQVALAAELIDSAQRIKHRSWQRTLLLSSASLATIVALGLTVFFATRRNDSRSTGDRLSASPATSTSLADRATVSSSIPVSVTSPASLSLGELSGPEMEALFDLLPRDSKHRGSVSF